jgi:L-rhamnose-H+ transport protein
METGLLIGFVYLLIGAICGGSFGLPSKYAGKDTPWEVLWGPFFFFVTILIPTVVAPAVVKDLFAVYEKAGAGTMAAALGFGFLWGLGSMTLGKSFAFIGLSLAYSLNYGAQIITGSMVPMAIHNRGDFLTSHGAVIVAGVLVCVLGVIVAGRAGILKERSLKKDEAPEPDQGDKKNPKMMAGVILAVASGVLCACWAVASGFAGPIGSAAAEKNPPWAAAWAFTAVILWGGAISACLYCVVQLTKNKTWGHLTKPGIGKILLLAFVMAALHDGAVFFFGLAWINIGDLGVSVGYAAFMSFAIIVGNFHGFRTGEWKGASGESIRWIAIGILLLVIGVSILAVGKHMAAG